MVPQFASASRRSGIITVFVFHTKHGDYVIYTSSWSYSLFFGCFDCLIYPISPGVSKREPAAPCKGPYFGCGGKANSRRQQQEITRNMQRLPHILALIRLLEISWARASTFPQALMGRSLKTSSFSPGTRRVTDPLFLSSSTHTPPTKD